MTEYAYFIVLNEDQRVTFEAVIGDSYPEISQVLRNGAPEFSGTRNFLPNEELLKLWKANNRYECALSILAGLPAEPSEDARAEAEILRRSIRDYQAAHDKLRPIRSRFHKTGLEIQKMEERGERDGAARLRSERKALVVEKERLEAIGPPESVTRHRQMIELDENQYGNVRGMIRDMIEDCDALLKDGPKAPYDAYRRHGLEILDLLSIGGPILGYDIDFESDEEHWKRARTGDRYRFARQVLSKRKAEGGEAARKDVAVLEELIAECDAAMKEIGGFLFRYTENVYEMDRLKKRDDRDGIARLRSENEALVAKVKRLEEFNLPQIWDLHDMLPSGRRG